MVSLQVARGPSYWWSWEEKAGMVVSLLDDALFHVLYAAEAVVLSAALCRTFPAGERCTAVPVDWMRQTEKKRDTCGSDVLHRGHDDGQAAAAGAAAVAELVPGSESSDRQALVYHAGQHMNVTSSSVWSRTHHLAIACNATGSDDARGLWLARCASPNV
ncbi:hypothetical protein GUJ93_ZPchr0007g3579 [Zizania palustris]|uniref:Uncharacterized protein n=1 Tax=Zizania palustris TaxID=103762 RepID=A0A8J5SJW4_ZIZPA|nr:hypothetical protein GUJ93_ZPchr0007g3579 [Zizania palustris]